MSFSIRATMCQLLHPQHEISCSSMLWQYLTDNLRRRGGGYRESGAFLLGSNYSGRARIKKIVFYDDLDPHSLESGIVRIDGRYFGKLWDICRQTRLAVVADVHTHPRGSAQSPSDRNNPMIARSGHIAFIIPNYATSSRCFDDLGIYRYLGNHRWLTVRDRSFLYVGVWG